MPTLPIKAFLPYLLLSALAMLIALLPEAWQAALAFDRSVLAQGELWRLLSGHLVHSNGYHLLMNLCGLFVIMVLHGAIADRLALYWQWLLLSLLTSLALWCWASDIEVYVGLSGVLHGMLSYGAIMDIRQHYRSGYLILAGIAIKLAAELYSGPDAELATKIAAEVAIEAHLWGAIAGVVLALACLAYTALFRRRAR